MASPVVSTTRAFYFAYICNTLKFGKFKPRTKMSTPTYVQSNQVPLALSTDGITYKNVVCKRAWNFNGSTPVNTEETDCGVAKGLGASDWTMDFEGVLNTTPNGASEMSLKDVLALWVNQTLSYIKTQSGSSMYIQGEGYITDFAIQNSVGNLVAFTFTFNGIGNPDITA